MFPEFFEELNSQAFCRYCLCTPLTHERYLETQSFMYKWQELKVPKIIPEVLIQKQANHSRNISVISEKCLCYQRNIHTRIMKDTLLYVFEITAMKLIFRNMIGHVQASTYEACNHTCIPLHTHKALETCKKKHALFHSKSITQV